MTSRRKSRRLSCCHHVRLSGGNLQSVWRFPFRLVPFITWNMESQSNLKSLDVRDDETTQTNPRPRLPGWTRFASGVSSRKKTISLTETLAPWVFLSSFDSPAGDEGYGPKDEFWKMRKDSRAPRVSLLGLSHENPGNWNTLLFLVYERLDSESPQHLITMIWCNWRVRWNTSDMLCSEHWNTSDLLKFIDIFCQLLLQAALPRFFLVYVITYLCVCMYL
jgi:hypothetical protein